MDKLGPEPLWTRPSSSTSELREMLQTKGDETHAGESLEEGMRLVMGDEPANAGQLGGARQVDEKEGQTGC